MAYIGSGQHILWVNQSSKQAHKLDCSSKFRICITNHMFYNEVDEQNILVRKMHIIRITYYKRMVKTYTKAKLQHYI